MTSTVTTRSIANDAGAAVMSRTMGWGVYVGSLVGWTIGVGLVFAAAAALYNRFTEQASTARERAQMLATR